MRTLAIIPQSPQVTMLYAINLHRAVGQLHLNKTEREKKVNKISLLVDTRWMMQGPSLFLGISCVSDIVQSALHQVPH